MADIRLSIVNQALTAAGEETLTTLTPGTVMANAAIENYDAFVEEELENGSWQWASKVGTPTLLTAELDAPLQYQWRLPADVLTVKAVLRDGVSLDGEYFELQGRNVRTAYNTDITVKYIYRAAEEIWPQRFRRIIVQRLEALFLRVTERHSEAAKRDSDTDIKTMISRHTESSQRRNRPVGDGSLVEARRGARRRRSV